MIVGPTGNVEDDLRRWRAQFEDATPIADIRPRHPATVVGVVERIRLAPGNVEVMVNDGTGRLRAAWTGRARLPGVELGCALRLHSTVSRDSDGTWRMLNPRWAIVTQPYA